MKDDEDGIIDLIFYCVGCNIVDILGMVGEFTPLPHFLLKHCQWQVVIYILSFFVLIPGHPVIDPTAIVFCEGNIGVLFILLTPGLLKHKTGFHK